MPKYAEFIVGLVIFLFLFFAIFLFTYQKGNRLSKNLLGFFFLALGLAVADVAMQMNNTYQQFPHTAFIFNTLPFLYGPLLWLLTKSVTLPNYKLQRRDFLHFLPYIISLLIFVFAYHIRPLAYKEEFLRHVQTGDDSSLIFSSALIFTIIAIYIFWSFRQLQKYRSTIKEQVSNIDKINLSWLAHTLIGFIAIISLSAFIQVLIYLLDQDTFWLNGILLVLLFGLLFFVMSSIVKGLRSDVIFANTLAKETIITPKSKIINQVDEPKLDLLKKHMETAQPFLNPSLSLKELATQINLPARELSGIINQGTQQSFFDFINSYRIQFAQDKIRTTTDDKLTILEVMYAAGFNSKSSFNTAFKKHTKLTPTQWKKQLTDN